MKALSTTLILACVSVWSGCQTPNRGSLIRSDQRAHLEAAEAAAIHVDASAPEGGDGSAARPLRSLTAALADEKKSTVILAPGLYDGPIPCGMRKLKGPRTAVVFGEGDVPAVVEASAGCVLEGVSVQGGAVGVRVAPGALGEVRVVVRDVAFSGQRRASLEVGGGELLLEDSELTASISELIGVRVLAARAEISHVAFRGPFRTGVELGPPPMNPSVLRGELVLRHLRFDESANAVRARGPGRVDLAWLDVDRGRGVGVDLQDVTGTARHLTVRGHEVGVRVGGHASMSLEDLVLAGAERAGLVVANATARVNGLVVVGSGNYGGVQVVGGQLELRDGRFHDTHGDAVVVVDGELALTDVSVTRPRSTDGADGVGVQLRRSRARLLGLDVADAGYVGVLFAESTQASAQDLVLRGGRAPSVVAETQAVARVGSLTFVAAGSSILVAATQAQLGADAVEDRRLAGAGVPSVMSACNEDARLVMGWMRPKVSRSTSPCEGRVNGWLHLDPPRLPTLDSLTR